jgi:hypothetical protein
MAGRRCVKIHPHMAEDTPCKRAGCGHPISIHTMRLAEKRAQLEGTIALDFPSGREDPFNYHAGRSNSSCNEPGCGCLAFISPYA